MDCGTNYESVLTCCCPECGSGVINQLCMNDVDVFKRKSYAYTTEERQTVRTNRRIKKVLIALRIVIPLNKKRPHQEALIPV
ncbi:hypothetical protein VPPG_00116 [Vibrio phage VD1]|nr:hypothetical protein VPPG_00116 [Vibrio phage VD1]